MATTRATRGNNRPARRRRPEQQLRRWILFTVPLFLIIGLVLANGLSGSITDDVPATAPDFTLPDTAGGAFRLADALEDGDTLLYFSMGVGCDGCFAQIPEIAHVLEERGITLASVMVDAAPAVAAEAARFGITAPILIDADRRVSEAYGMMGVYGHADRPSHSFALVRSDGSIADVAHYATMFVPAEQLLTDFDL